MPLPTVSNEPTNTDDFGYEVENNDEQSSVEPATLPTPPTLPTNEGKVEEPANKESEKKTEQESTVSTGYGKKVEDVKPPVETPAPKDEEKPAESDSTKEVEEVVKGLPDSVDKDKLLKFATDHKLTVEQVKAYSKIVEEDVAKEQVTRQEAITKTRGEWVNQLKTDTDFGGDHFDTNVSRVEKLIENHMPNIKKELTTRGTMLPPSIMKDLLSLWKVMNPTTTFEAGTPSSSNNEKHFLEEMYE